MTAFNRYFIYATSFLKMMVLNSFAVAQETSAYVPTIDTRTLLSLDMSSQYLFRGMQLGDSGFSAALGADKVFMQGIAVGGSFRATQLPSEADVITELHISKLFDFRFLDVGLSGEYINWHHSTYNPMALVGMSIIKDRFRILYKKDIADLGGSHFQMDYEMLNQNGWKLGASYMDTVAPTDWYTYNITIIDPDDNNNTITQTYTREDALNLKLVSLQAGYKFNPFLQIYTAFYCHLDEPDVDQQVPLDIPETDKTQWVLGLRWTINP